MSTELTTDSLPHHSGRAQHQSLHDQDLVLRDKIGLQTHPFDKLTD